MKRFGKSVLGVTLLEIMLVLAVAAMVIVMSIRYYQSASNSQNANIIMQQIQGITAAADNLAQSTGSYSAITTDSVKAVVGAKNMTTPYGVDIALSAPGATTYTVTIGTVPAAVCTTLKSQLGANPKLVSGTTCPATGSISFSYVFTSTSA